MSNQKKIGNGLTIDQLIKLAKSKNTSSTVEYWKSDSSFGMTAWVQQTGYGPGIIKLRYLDIYAIYIDWCKNNQVVKTVSHVVFGSFLATIVTTRRIRGKKYYFSNMTIEELRAKSEKKEQEKN